MKIKRVAWFLVLILLIHALTVSASSAETICQTNLFEFSVPSSWSITEAKNFHVECEHRENGILVEKVGLIDSKRSRWPSDPAELASMVKDLFGLKAIGGWEEIEIDGQSTVLVSILKEEKCTGYATVIKTGLYNGLFFYIFSEPYGGKEAAEKLLEGFKVRSKDDSHFFRFGDAEVKLKGFRTKTVGKNKYLLVDFTWRNVGNTTDMFVVNVSVTAYQNGIQLKDGFLPTEDTEVGTSIMPGKSLTVTEVFQMRESTGEITLIVDKLMDYSHECQERQYSFKVE